ncbi:hypothetical protein, partial [Escherichia coli]
PTRKSAQNAVTTIRKF